jgi:ABC-2 type transport system ATP-binding protein
MAPPADTVVQVASLVRRFDGVTAVDGISFEVRRGEMFGLIGPDGAGKTTTLKSVLGLLRPDAGSVRVFGFDPLAQPRDLARHTGYLAQRFTHYGDLSIDENVSFFAQVHGVRGWRKRRDDLLEMLRLTPFRKRLADRLSGGMKQKLALACTLVHTPELLVLDEPTTGVDPVSRRDFWRILSRLQRDGMTLLVTTPYLDEAERCQRVGLMDRGRMLALDTPDALRRAAPGVVIEVLARPRRQALEVLHARSEVSDVQTFGERLHATLASTPSSRAADAARTLSEALAAAKVEVLSVRPTLASLEDVFIARVGGADAARPPDAARDGTTPGGAS